jgi:hypothetical protein
MNGSNGKLDYHKRSLPKLSFGVELEFALATIPYRRTDPDPEDGRQVYGITQREDRALAKELPADRARRAQEHISNTLTEAGFSSMREPDSDGQPREQYLDRWIITQDSSIKGPSGELRYSFQPIEMQSPAYLMTEGSLKEVQRVCHLMTKTYRTYSGPTSSVHVHVGNKKQGFPLETLQNLMALLWTFEPQLETLHPEHRQKNGYCGSMRRSSQLMVRMKQSKIDLRGSLDEIYNTKSISELILLMGFGYGETGYKLGFNMSNLLESYVNDDGEHIHIKSPKKTIEFRHHEGTMDPVAIYHWTKVCVNFVEFAEEVWTSKLRVWLRCNIDRKVVDYPAVAVLCALKIPVQAMYYEKKLAERGDDPNRT